MVNMLNITRPETPELKEWVNLDQVFHIGLKPHPNAEGEMTNHVMLFQDPGGNGLVLPEHISLAEVLSQLQIGGM